GYIHPSGGIDSRTKPKTYAFACHLIAAAGDLHQRAKARLACCREPFEPVMNYCTVLTVKIHNVRYGPDCRDVQQILNPVILTPCFQQ
ncbi:hypothetical protein OFN30_31740, partial [Escherichia coli]|nr:hypothetical protein [Escherichia coli]